MNFIAAPIASLWFQRVTAASFFLLFLGNEAAGHLGKEKKEKQIMRIIRENFKLTVTKKKSIFSSFLFSFFSFFFLLQLLFFFYSNSDLLVSFWFLFFLVLSFSSFFFVFLESSQVHSLLSLLA